MLYPIKCFVKRVADHLGFGPLINLRTNSPRVTSLEQFLGSSLPAVVQRRELSIDLGSGLSPRRIIPVNRSMGIDVVGNNCNDVLVSDLFSKPIPFHDGTAAVVYAFDFLEHVPRYSSGPNEMSSSPFINLMNEVHRVLEPGGIFLSSTPAFPYPQAFQDPTHVNIITEQTLPQYFCRHSDGSLPWARHYGFIGEFELISQAWFNWSLLTLLRRP